MRTVRKEHEGVTYQAVIERRDDGSQKILFSMVLDDAEKVPIPIKAWSAIGALCEVFKEDISEI